MASADAELERLLKETGKQLSLPHDYVDGLLHVLDVFYLYGVGLRQGCSTPNLVHWLGEQRFLILKKQPCRSACFPIS
ncbi:hypothetical protein Hdeb2414_s0013g00403551 [Helianthus debilis subsp. tardiflorus]